MIVYAIIPPNDGKNRIFFFCIMTDYRYCPISTHQAQTIQLTYMLGPRRKQINPGGVDATVTQHIGQPHDISMCLIKSLRKQMAQVVGKHLGGFHIGGSAQLFHLSPDLPP